MEIKLTIADIELALKHEGINQEHAHKIVEELTDEALRGIEAALQKFLLTQEGSARIKTLVVDSAHKRVKQVIEETEIKIKNYNTEIGSLKQDIDDFQERLDFLGRYRGAQKGERGKNA